MHHACFTPFASCFVYTSLRFYAISRTNLLTRCHRASSLFSALFVFQKSYTGNILRIGQNKSQNSYFSQTKDEYRKRAGGGPEGRLTRGWHAPWPCQGVVRPPWWPSNAASQPIKSFQTKNPRSIGVFREEVLQLCRHHRWISGDRNLCFGTLPGWGSAPEDISIDIVAYSAISIDFTAISTNVVVSYDEEGVVLPRGWGLYR
jgi:hypothetical protein